MALILSKAPHKVADEVLGQYDEPNEDDQVLSTLLDVILDPRVRDV